MTAAILNFTKSGIFSNRYPNCITNICPHTKIEGNIIIVERDMPKNRNSKMAAAATLSFNKSVILGPNDPCMVNIYLQTKFGANRSTEISEIQPSAILDLFSPNFGLSPDVPLDELNFLC